MDPKIRPEDNPDTGEIDRPEDSIARVIATWGESRPDLDVTPIGVTARVFRLANELRPRLDAVLGRHGVRGNDFSVIATLVRVGKPSLSQGTLAAELNLSPGTISVRVDGLERQGLVERRQDADDQRRTAVALTAKGRELFEASAPEHIENCRQLLAGLEEGERERLGALLGKLLGSLEDPGLDELLLSLGGVVVSSLAESLWLRREVGLPPLPGVLVRRVEPEGAAAEAGVRRGDLIRAVDGRQIRTAADLRTAFASALGGKCGLDLVRGVEALEVGLRPRGGDATDSGSAAAAAGKED